VPELIKNREKNNQKGRNLRKVIGFSQEGNKLGEKEDMENRSRRIDEINSKDVAEHDENDDRFWERRTHHEESSKFGSQGRPKQSGMRQLRHRRFANHPHSKAGKHSHMRHWESPHFKMHGSCGFEFRDHRTRRDIILEIEHLEQHSRRINRRLHALTHELAARS